MTARVTITAAALVRANAAHLAIKGNQQ